MQSHTIYTTGEEEDNNYGWFRDLDTNTNVVVLECKHHPQEGVYKICPMYVPYEPSYSSNEVNIVNLENVDIESQQTFEKKKSQYKKRFRAHIECTKRVLYAITICALYICVCW